MDNTTQLLEISAAGTFNDKNSYLYEVESSTEYYYLFYNSISGLWEFEYGDTVNGIYSTWVSEETVSLYPWETESFNRIFGSDLVPEIRIDKKGPENIDPTFIKEVSGGPISNYSYLDYSGLKSVLNIGNYFCEPTLIFHLSSYDESVSVISKVVYEYKNKIFTLFPNISTFKTSINTLTTIQVGENEFVEKNITQVVNRFVYTSPKNQIFTIKPSPGFNYITTDTLYLSVIKFDNTVNTHNINFNIIHCGILDIYGSSTLLNSQLLNSPDKILLTLEDSNTKRVYNSILRTDIPFVLLTGGDIIELTSEETEPDAIFEFEATDQPGDVFLAEQIKQKALPVKPTPPPRINPVVPPDQGEYFYRGEKGIRIRPLLVRLLPRQEFFYEIPYSGLILLSGGAPYFPGRGISFNVEYRVI
jgi:hypothetical protein